MHLPRFMILHGLTQVSTIAAKLLTQTRFRLKSGFLPQDGSPVLGGHDPVRTGLEPRPAVMKTSLFLLSIVSPECPSPR